MKPPLALLLCIMLIYVSTAIVSPLFYCLFHSWLDYPFHRYVDRTLMLSAIVWLALLWKHLGVRSFVDDLPFRTSHPFRKVLFGLALGLASSLGILVLTVFLHLRDLVRTPHLLFLLGLTGGALALAFLEEALFRGLIQNLMVRQFKPRLGIILTTIFFVLVHFLKVSPDFNPAVVQWNTGWEAVSLLFTPLVQGECWSPYLATLFLVGGILSLVVLLDRSLWPAIGLHAGWVIGLRLGEEISQPTQTGGWLYGSMVEHPFTIALLSGLLFILLLKSVRHVQN